MEVDYEGFSIREYTRNIRSVEVRKCWPFSGDLIHSLLPPLTVVKFRWWSNELASLLAKSPVAVDDSDPVFRRKATKPKPKPCKKRSIVENFAVEPQIQLANRDEDDGDDADVLIGSKRKRIQKLVAQKKIKSKNPKDSGDRKFPNKVSKCKEQARIKMDDGKKDSPLGVIMSLSRKKAESVSKEHDTEFPIPGIFCSVRSDDNSKMNRLSLSSSKNQSFVNDKNLYNVQTSDNLQLESTQQNKLQLAVSDRRLSNVPRGKSGLSCFHGPHPSSQERVDKALELERKGNVSAQPASVI